MGPTDCDVVRWYTDEDGDGYGAALIEKACEGPEGAVAVDGDCDDTDRSVHPGADEACDGIDNDCDLVSDEGCVGACDINVPGDATTIQAAIDGAAAGAVICVAAGTWYESLDLHGAAVTVVGVEGALATVIDGSSGESPVVTMQSGEGPDTVLRGFTLQHGSGDDGGGLVLLGVSPTLMDLLVQDNHASDLGGGAFVDGGGPTFLGVRIADNSAWRPDNDGYNTGAMGGMELHEAAARLDNVWISGNTTAGNGAGLGVYGGTVVATHLAVTGNRSYYCGGALDILGAEMSVYGFVISDNTGASSCGSGGMGIAVLESTVTLRNGLVAGNVLDLYDSSYSGGGVYVDASDVTIDGVVITGNEAAWAGGIRVIGSVVLEYSDVWGNLPNDIWGMPDPVGAHGNLDVDPGIVDAQGHLDIGSPLVDAGNPAAADPDGSRSDIGAFGGLTADGWDLDGDGVPAWWKPGGWDASADPGTDCDDLDPLRTTGC